MEDHLKAGTKDRGSAWTEIAERLAGCGLKRDTKISTRKIRQLDERFPKEGKRREKQSGVDVEYGIAGFEELREGEEQKQKKEKAS